MIYVFAILSTLFLINPVFAQNSPILFGQRIFAINGPMCTGTIDHQNWITSHAIRIAKIQIWNGLDYGHASDIPEIVTRISDGAILIDGGHDDYTNGGGVRIQSQDWGGNYFPLAAGDGLTFSYMCTDPTAHGGWVVTIWTK